MKYSLRSLMLIADPDMGNIPGYLLMLLILFGVASLVMAGIIFGLKWFLARYWAALVSAKFTIRELLMATTMVAVVLGWLVDHWRQASEVRYLMKWKDELNVDNFYLNNELVKLRAPAPNTPKP